MENEQANITNTPFTDEQVKNIQRYQTIGYVHEMTCGGEHISSAILMVDNDGLFCPYCDYKQKWVPSCVADGSVIKEMGDIMKKFQADLK